MESGLSSLLSISIDFETSHLFFPMIIHWVLALLFLAVLVTKTIPFLAAVRRGERTLPIIGESMDSFRFFGTLALMVAYFYLMAFVGNMFPYTGYGFLFVSKIQLGEVVGDHQPDQFLQLADIDHGAPTGWGPGSSGVVARIAGDRSSVANQAVVVRSGAIVPGSAVNVIARIR